MSEEGWEFGGLEVPIGSVDGVLRRPRRGRFAGGL